MSLEAATDAGADADGGLVSALEDSGVGLVSGVPCSYLTEPIRRLEGHPSIRYVPAVNEGAALSVAAGAWLAGTPSAVLAQNSGFGNLINPLTSLVLPYRIPLLAVVSMRGWPKPSAGEPQHRWMGQVVPAWLESLGIAYRTATADGPPIRDLLDELRPSLEAREPAFLLVTKGSLGPGPGASAGSGSGTATEPDGRPGVEYALTRRDLVEAVLAEVEDEFVLATTGYLSRELYLRGDRERNLYLQGSMGHVASVALGAALARPGEGFVVLDGDGAFLMHLGAVTGVGHFAPGRFVHVVFDNGGYESTGGQPVAAGAADLAQLAVAAGYRHVERVDTVAGLRSALAKALRWQGPGLLLVRGVRSPVSGSRASEDLPVDVLAQRFRDALQAANRPEAGQAGTAPIQVAERYPEPWSQQPDLPLFATPQWQEIMAGRIEGEPHWFWTRQPDPADPADPVDPQHPADRVSFEVGFAGTLVRDAGAYVWGNPVALTADPRSPLISEQTANRLAARGVTPADLLPCLALTYPGYASFPVGSLAHDEHAVARTLTGIAEWAVAQGLVTVALPYADGTSALAGIARRLGYHPVPITVESVLEVGPGGFAGHLGRLPSPRRRKLAAERRHLADAAVHGRLVQSVSEALFGRLVELRCNQRHKYDMPVDRPAEAARLARFLRALGDRVTVFVVEVDPEAGPEAGPEAESPRPPGADPAAVVAFSLFARDGDCWHAMYTGTDYANPHSRNSYFEALFYAPLDLAATLGVRRISYGHAADQAKLLRGCTTVPVECLLLGLTPAARTAARRVAAAWSGEGE